MSKDTISIKKDDLWKYSTIVLVVILAVIGIIALSGNTNNPGTSDPTGPGEQPSVVRASIGDAPVIGDEDAPVTIIEYQDYLCSFCGRHHQQTFPMIKSEYVDQGIVKYAVKDFITVGISQVNEVAHCARDQSGDEGYFEMMDLLYGNQQQIAQASNRMTVYTDLGSQMGLDTSTLESCVSNGDHTSTVSEGRQEALSTGGTGTPHFVILQTGESEGTPIRGAQPFSAFQQAIESLL